MIKFAAMLNQLQLKELLIPVKQAALKAGNYIREERKKFNYSKVEVKGLNDLVSHVDKNSEQLLVNELQLAFPSAGFLVEENTISENKEYNWIVDPLDGTTNFVHGIPCYAVSIGLEFKGQIILAVVYEVSRDECFYATKNGGAFLSDMAIQISERKTLAESLIGTGFPINNFDRLDNYLKTISIFMQSTQGIRRIGSAASDLCYLACGRLDAFFEYNLNPWDVAAGALIVEEAGGIVKDFKNKNNWLFGKEICAGNPFMFHEFQKIVGDTMKKMD